MQKDKDSNKEQPGETSGQTGKMTQKQSNLQPQSKSISWQSQGMEVEYTEPNDKSSNERADTSQEPQIIEEDPKPLDIGELDILGLEQACKRGNFEKYQIGKWIT